MLGLIGKPNAGKSTFFHAATLKPVEIANYPFTTIDANVGIAHVRIECPHKEINKKCNPKHGFCLEGNRFVPIELMDVAGLIPGAHKGKGLGNKFLDDVRKADVLIMVVDASGKTDIEGNEGEGNPIDDISFVEEEFDMWLHNIILKIIEKKRHGNISLDDLTEKLSGLNISRFDIEKALSVYEPKDFEFARYLRKIAKPMIIAANKSDIDSSNEWLHKLKKLDYVVVPTSAAYEAMLRKAAEKGFIKYIPGDIDFEILKDMNEKQIEALEKARSFMKKFNGTGVQTVLNKAVFELGNNIAVFPVENENTWEDKNGNVLPDCFLVKKGTKAREFAYKLHTDIGEGFIRAIDARTKRIIGADYELKHLDVIKIVFRS